MELLSVDLRGIHYVGDARLMDIGIRAVSRFHPILCFIVSIVNFPARRLLNSVIHSFYRLVLEICQLLVS